MINENIEINSIYTFGAPRIGDFFLASFADFYLKGKYFRVTKKGGFFKIYL